MLTNEYLYGKEVEVPEIESYVIMRRLELLKEHLSELLKEDYMKRSTSQIIAVEKAINFWEKIGEQQWRLRIEWVSTIGL